MKRILILIVLILNSVPVSAQTTYYVSSSGSDANNGTSTATPWKTLNKVTNTTFATSDQILLKRGDTLYGEFSKPGWMTGYVGTALNPFYIGAYGTGAKPIIMLDGSNLVWTQRAGYDSVWAAWIGYCYSVIGYEKIGNVWTRMTEYSGGIRTELDHPESLDVYLKSLTPSSYGPALHETVGDTVYCKTHDGLAPNVKILRQNFFEADYLKMENLDFRNGWHAINAYPANNSSFLNLYSRNFIGIALFLAGGSNDNLVEGCRADSGAYTAFYSWYAHRNKFRYDTVYIIQDTIMGIYSSIEQGGFGFERDTATVIEYCVMDGCSSGGIDAFYNYQDTVRYCTVRNCGGGIWLNGDSWVAHNNTVSDVISNGTSISVQIVRYTSTWNTDGGGLTSGAGQTHVYNNTLDVGSQGRGINLTSNVAKGTLLVEGNTITGDNTSTSLVLYETTGVTSIKNSFMGLGRWSASPWTAQVFYTTLAGFQAATGFEAGSKYYSGPPTGTFTVTLDSLVAGGDSVMIQWSSVDADSVSISPRIGNVRTSGDTTIFVDTTTTFVLTLSGPLGTVRDSVRVTVGQQPAETPKPLNFFLKPNFPNPFNGSTIIEFMMPNDGNASLKVFDILGREIQTLAQGMYLRGTHQFRWNADGVASGVYYCAFTSGSYTQTRRMMVVR